jgi:transposase
MDGTMSKTHRLLVRAMLDHIDDLSNRIGKLDKIIEDEMADYDKAIDLLDTIPGIGRDSAQTILAEIGLDMDRFPSAGNLAKWAGLCPGNNESAGKRKGGRSGKGNITLKATLVQSAVSAVKKKDSFLRAQYDRLVVRKGVKRARVAIAHSMLIAIWHMLKKGEPFSDLGSG